MSGPIGCFHRLKLMLAPMFDPSRSLYLDDIRGRRNWCYPRYPKARHRGCPFFVLNWARWGQSHGAAGGGGGGPCPLEVEAAKVAGDVDDFSDEVEAGDGAALHGLRGEHGGADAAGGDFGLLIAFGSGWREGEVVQTALQLVEGGIGPF